MSPVSPIQITCHATEPVTNFSLAFYNRDNLYGPGNPKPLYLSPGVHYVMGVSGGLTTSHTFTLDYNTFNRPDYHPDWDGTVATHLQTMCYFSGGATCGFSAPDPQCVQVPNLLNCGVDLTPDSSTIYVGQSTGFNAGITFNQNASVNQINFTPGNSRLSCSPSADSSSPYGTTCTGISAGSSNLGAQVQANGFNNVCRDTSYLTVNPAPSPPTLTATASCTMGTPEVTLAFADAYVGRYELFKSSGSCSVYSRIVDTGPGITSGGFIDPNVLDETQYCYYVRHTRDLDGAVTTSPIRYATPMCDKCTVSLSYNGVPLNLSPATPVWVSDPARQITANVVPSRGSVMRTDFGRSPLSNASINLSPTIDWAPAPYFTNASPSKVSEGQTTVTARVYMNTDGVNRVVCQASGNINVITPPKYCTVSTSLASPITYPQQLTATVTGNAYVPSWGSNNVRLFAERRDGQRTFLPGEFLSGSNYNTPLGSCLSSGYNPCTVTSSLLRLPTDHNYAEYYFHCDVPIEADRCTGSPFCNNLGAINPPVSAPTTFCSGWVSCDMPTHPDPAYAPPDYTYMRVNRPQFTVSGGLYEWLGSPVNTSRPIQFRDYDNYVRLRDQNSQWWFNANDRTQDIVNGGAGAHTFTFNPVPGYIDAGNIRIPPETAGQYWLYLVDPAIAGNTLPVGWRIEYPASGIYNNFWDGTVTPPGELVRNEIRNFFLTPAADAWWQTSVGEVGAQQAIMSLIPDTVPPAQQYLSLANTSDPGVALSGTDTVDLLFGQVNSRGDYRIGSGYNTGYIMENYQHFWTLLQMPPSPPSDNFSGDRGNAVKRASSMTPYYSSASLTIRNSSWQIASGETVMVFVNGNLTIGGAGTDISVTPGGFLAFIVNGDIIIESTVGNDNNAPAGAFYRTVGSLYGTSNVEGVFVANGAINVQSNGTMAEFQDIQFVGEGVFAAWDGIILNRALAGCGGDLTCVGLDNNTEPGEIFRYRPDMMINAPEAFRRSRFDWEEVAP